MSRSLKLLTAPATEAILTTDEAKLWLRVTHSEENTLIDKLVLDSVSKLQSVTNRQLFTAEYTLIDKSGEHPVTLPKPPAVSVDAIRVYDGENNELSVTSGYYFTDLKSTPATIEFNEDGITLIDNHLSGYGFDRLEVGYTCGYGATAADIPNWAVGFCRNYLAQFYAMRMGYDPNVARGIENIDKQAVAYRVEIL
jgi:uncharacterized phiE125 gp8 family phage protein